MEYLRKTIPHPNAIVKRCWGSSPSKKRPIPREILSRKNKSKKAGQSSNKLSLGTKKYLKSGVPKAYDKQNLLKQIQDHTISRQEEQRKNGILKNIYNQLDEGITMKNILNTASQLKIEGMIKMLESIRKDNDRLQEKLQERRCEHELVKRSQNYCKLKENEEAHKVYKEEIRNMKQKYLFLKKSLKLERKQQRRIIEEQFAKQYLSAKTLESAIIYQEELSQYLQELREDSQKLQSHKNELTRKKNKLYQQLQHFDNSKDLIMKEGMLNQLDLGIRRKNKQTVFEPISESPEMLEEKKSESLKQDGSSISYSQRGNNFDEQGSTQREGQEEQYTSESQEQFDSSYEDQDQ